MITADQLFVHALGDYVLQSDWMATEKTKKSVAAAAHATVYSLPFLMLTRALAALAVICVTHFIIDRWRLARYVVWAKNWIAPWPLVVLDRTTVGVSDAAEFEVQTARARLRRPPTPPFKECAATGYPPDRPAWLVVWLLIISDNLMHVAINAAALRWLS